MNKKIAAFLLSLFLIGCGNNDIWNEDSSKSAQQEGEVVATPNDQLNQEQTPIPPIANNQIPPTLDPVPENNTPTPPTDPIDTGSTNPDVEKEEPTIMAQYSGPGHPRYRMGNFKPPSITARGLETSEYIELEISDPPSEFNVCVGGMKFEYLPDISLFKQLQKHSGWWLVASDIGINRLTPEKPIYFYWATLVAEDEIALVPANFSTDKFDKTDPPNTKIKTNKAVLPYIWVDNLAVSHPYPHDEKECKKA